MKIRSTNVSTDPEIHKVEYGEIPILGHPVDTIRVYERAVSFFAHLLSGTPPGLLMNSSWCMTDSFHGTSKKFNIFFIH